MNEMEMLHARLYAHTVVISMLLARLEFTTEQLTELSGALQRTLETQTGDPHELEFSAAVSAEMNQLMAGAVRIRGARH